MTSTSIAAFARRAAGSINESFGQTVTIAGANYTAVVSTATPALDLEAGGFRSPASCVVRVPKAFMATPPAKRAAVVVSGENYRVVSVRLSSSPLAQEWIIDVETA